MGTCNKYLYTTIYDIDLHEKLTAKSENDQRKPVHQFHVKVTPPLPQSLTFFCLICEQYAHVYSMLSTLTTCMLKNEMQIPY